VLRRPLLSLSLPCAAVALTLVATAAPATAAPPIGLGVVGSFGVLAGTTVTNSGPTVVYGDLGVSPGSAITGFDQPGGPGSVLGGGAIHKADAVAGQAQSALTTAYNQAAGSPSTANVTGTNVGNRVLQPGVYTDSSAMSLNGVLTLDGGGNPAAVFIFQAGSSLTVAGSSSVVFIGAAQPCNVFWQVTSTATIGTNAAFAGTVMALTDINVNTGATIQGRLLARNGQVTLLSNVITRPACATTPTAPTATPTPTASSSPTATKPPKPHVTLISGDNDNNNNNNSGNGTAGSDSGGSGSDTGTDLTPTVPLGHPETGQKPAPGDDGRLWLLGAVACLAGAAGAAARSTRRRVPVASSDA
jgi:ice-binding like protein